MATKTAVDAEQRVEHALHVVDQVAVQQQEVVAGDEHLQPFAGTQLRPCCTIAGANGVGYVAHRSRQPTISFSPCSGLTVSSAVILTCSSGSVSRVVQRGLEVPSIVDVRKPPVSTLTPSIMYPSAHSCSSSSAYTRVHPAPSTAAAVPSRWVAAPVDVDLDVGQFIGEAAGDRTRQQYAATSGCAPYRPRDAVGDRAPR